MGSNIDSKNRLIYTWYVFVCTVGPTYDVWSPVTAALLGSQMTTDTNNNLDCVCQPATSSVKAQQYECGKPVAPVSYDSWQCIGRHPRCINSSSTYTDHCRLQSSNVYVYRPFSTIQLKSQESYIGEGGGVDPF